ncbi:AAA family ATPase [Actinomadura fulvescens]|uniref:AAA family ATPase n=1 Tax=Actinomadura fulvescens TaxID=46160 RepID=A0ABN3QIH8_9ACTN
MVATLPLELKLVDLSAVQTALQARATRRYEDDREHDNRIKIVAFANGKGGVGKSSTSAAFAVAAARQGARVLLVELDPQGNNAEDLGFVRSDIADDGRAQAAAILNSRPLTPTGSPRKNLFVVPGGDALEEITEELYCQRRLASQTGDTTWLGMYAASLEQVYDDYDLIILDVAPGILVLQLQALVAADVVIVPSKSDPSSRKGLRLITRRFGEALQYNDSLVMLGVVLFAAGSSATRVKKGIRDDLKRDLAGTEVPVFETDIRHVEAVAVEARRRGLVPQELLKEKDLDASLRKSAQDLARDYGALTGEVLQAINQLRESLNEAEEMEEASA